MIEKLPSFTEKLFHDVITLGSFSPQSFCISLSSAHAAKLSALPVAARRTFNHEFGHLLHYLTSYVGLKDLNFWAQAIDIMLNPPSGNTPEEQVTLQAERVLSVAREKQVLSIDDAYYYEPQFRKFPDARANPFKWAVGETGGYLYKTDGTISSDHCFWATRFYIGNGGPSFIRIPVGIRTILEHMAKFIDFIGESHDRHPLDVATEFSDQAYEPELLRYYCLTHLVGPILARKYGNQEIWKSFLISGQLVLLLSEIPYDVPIIWELLCRYAEQHRPEMLPVMEKPHPSFVFPLLLHAVENSTIDFNSVDFNAMEDHLAALLREMKLPVLSELRLHKETLAAQVYAMLDKSVIGRDVRKLVEWAEQYAKSLGWSVGIIDPTRNLSDESPVPIVFDDGYYMNGSQFDVQVATELLLCVQRQNEMLRFPFTRNIVSLA
jgi:hypothetical protein